GTVHHQRVVPPAHVHDQPERGARLLGEIGQVGGRADGVRAAAARHRADGGRRARRGGHGRGGRVSEPGPVQPAPGPLLLGGAERGGRAGIGGGRGGSGRAGRGGGGLGAGRAAGFLVRVRVVRGLAGRFILGRKGGRGGGDWAGRRDLRGGRRRR